MKRAIVAALAAAACTSVVAATPQSYPARPIRFIIPYPPGGTSDILARLIGSKIAESWKQQVIVDNRTGASGNIGLELGARATPDGYNFVLSDIGNAVISSILYTKLPFDVLRDFAPVTIVSYSPHMLMVTNKTPVASIDELIAYAKTRPGKLNFPTGLGGAPHLAGLSFAQRAGVDWVYIPTKGGASSVAAMMAGEGDVMFLGMLQSLPHVNAGRLKLVAISSEKRLATHPKVPTVSETFPGFVTGSWQGILSPSKTPPELVAKMNAEVARILKLPDVIAFLNSQGTTPMGVSPQEAKKWLADERVRWAKVVKDSGFRLEQ
ncbi:MAG TPA: tripartite tricarboxylate transporter substrate binding protein [Burkholderiales bacterium]|nr:tripartite tricarboxylate transporter substrate binding protein [Burkholderiales bacterium]